jgi:hypothetical protein
LTSALSRAFRMMASFTVPPPRDAAHRRSRRRRRLRPTPWWRRVLRRTRRAERGAVVRLLEATEDLSADAGRRLQSLDGVNRETPLGIELAQLSAQPKAALGNGADPSPPSIADLEDRPHELSGRGISVGPDHASVLFLHARLPALEPSHRPEHPSSRSSGSNPVITMGTR